MALAAHRRTSQSVAAVVETEHHRFLLRDDAIIGCEHREPAVRDQIAFAAMAVMATVAFLVPTPRDVLCLGLGAGTVPHFLRAAGIRTDAVEIDEAVIRLAEQHFLIGSLGPHSGAAGGAIFHGDALRWAISGPTDPSWPDAAPADGQYDVVLCDMWSGANEGASLRRPFFAALRERWLRPGGVLAVNIVALLDGPHAALAVSVVSEPRLRAMADASMP
jgi:spermidine synthase